MAREATARHEKTRQGTRRHGKAPEGTGTRARNVSYSCFCYHEIDHLVSLFYVSGIINAFNWHYCMNFRSMFHMCDIFFLLGVFKKATAVNKYCVSINEI